MKKYIIFWVSLFSVLNIWANNGISIVSTKQQGTIDTLDQRLSEPQIWTQNVSFESGNVQEAIYSLEQSQEKVISKAKLAAIDSRNKERAEAVLTSTFKILDTIMGLYSKIKSDHQLKDEAEQVIEDFLNNYKDAILNNDRNDIVISTCKFIYVADDSLLKFFELYIKAQKYLKETRKEESNGAIVPDTTTADSELNIGTDSSGLYGDYDDETQEWVFAVILLISFIISIIALISSKSKKRDIKYLEEIRHLREDLTEQINALKKSASVGVSQTSERGYQGNGNHTQNTHEQRGGHRHDRNDQAGYYPPTPTPTPTPAPAPTPTPTPVPENRYLYATVKASSGSTEFSKVSNENTGDKVFQLILTKPDDESAEFTIAPNLRADFKKEVIANRDTYLPAIFCEKSIESANPAKIEALSKGRAKKVDGKWQVQDRMKIRFI